MDILADLKWRGLIHDISDPLILNKLTGQDSFYVGYDPTAPSLHLGNFIPMKVSMHLARAGLKAIQLFGGATGAIGDPSGRNAERQLLERSIIDDNVKNHIRIVSAIFERAGATAEFVNNYDWTKELSTLDFLREVGKHFPINYMLAKEVVKARLDGEGLSFTEFSYMLLQANDFYHLYTTKDCKLQIGGSDQWGNITAGLELIRRKLQGEACALSFPLVLDSSGKKFGKSAGNAVWLDARYTSPYKFHQFWMNIEDADVIRYLKMFTFLDQPTIDGAESALKAAPEKREAQKLLADSVCSLVHGEDATRDAKRCAEVLFGGSLDGLPDSQLEDIFSDVPSSIVPAEKISGMTALEAFVTAGLAKSKGEARRLITSGGAYINNQRVSEPERSVKESIRLEKSKLLVLRSGKKNYSLLKIE